MTAAGRTVLYAVAADSSSRPDSLKTETVTTRILDDLQKQGVIYLYVLIYEGYIRHVCALRELSVVGQKMT